MRMSIARRLLARFVLALPLVLAPIGVRAADDTGTSKPQASAPSPAQEKLTGQLKDLDEQLHDIVGPKGERVFADPQLRREIAPKAIPAMKKYVETFDKLAALDPDAKQQAAGVHSQFLSMMTALGDTDAERQLKEMTRAKGDEGVQAKTLLLVATWWRDSGNEAEQKKLIDQAAALMKANAANDGVASSILEMSAVGAATPAMRDAAEQVVLDNAKGEQAKAMAEDIRSARQMRQFEGKPVTLAGKTIDGHDFTSADWKGKVILVDFWATWCAPCRAELPRVQKTYEQYHNKGLEVLGVSCDTDAGELKKFRADNKGIAWPQLFDDKTADFHPLAKRFGITGIPTMFLIDKKGILRSVTAREDFEEQIPKLLAE